MFGLGQGDAEHPVSVCRVLRVLLITAPTKREGGVMEPKLAPGHLYGAPTLIRTYSRSEGRLAMAQPQIRFHSGAKPALAEPAGHDSELLISKILDTGHHA